MNRYHPGVIVCGDYRSDGMPEDADFVWGTADSNAAGLKTMKMIGPDALSAVQLANCTDTPNDSEQVINSSQSEQQKPVAGAAMIGTASELVSH